MYEVIGISERISRKEGQPDVTYVILHCKKPMRKSQGMGECVKTFNYKAGDFEYSANIGDLIIPEIEMFGKYPVVVDILCCNER